MDNNNILQKLEGLESRYEEVSTLITDPAPVRVTPASEDRAARLRESRRRFTAR